MRPCPTSPAPAKHALSRLGRCGAEVRLPLVQLGERSRARVDAALELRVVAARNHGALVGERG